MHLNDKRSAFAACKRDKEWEKRGGVDENNILGGEYSW